MDTVKDGSGHFESKVSITPEDGSDHAECEDDLSAAALDLSLKRTRESRAESPILGHYFKLPDLACSFESVQPILDSSLQYIPVYTHLITHELAPIERPATPTIIRKLRSGSTIQPNHRYKSRLAFNQTRINGIVDRAEIINDSGRSSKYQDSDGASSVRNDRS